MDHVVIAGLRKSFDGHLAVDGIDLRVKAGEIVALLGPSGCGKTTTLRCIAGLEAPTSGTITIGGRTVYSSQQGIVEPPERRGIGLVFQSYALWPHLTVRENVAYGLRVKRLPRAEIDARVSRILATVGLEQLHARYPGTLSGGQQQRVALARSLVVEAAVLLFDEPLSNLDLKLREEMRHELRQLVKRLGLTAVFVTHDQTEAMVIADRIALMHNGRILQEGPPRAVYEYPTTRFAMAFLGDANFLAAVPAGEQEGRAVVALANGQHLHSASPLACGRPGQPLTLAIRPEKVEIAGQAPSGENVLAGSVTEAVFLGNLTLYVVDCAGLPLRVQSAQTDFRPDDRVWLRLPPEWLLALAEE
ncbi:MAG: ABC transporter ATP-binding protein [Candidatus Lambdaproteobacteria bacterium]|nr:ABC transporter ATP-binding protein [Candidatus Lambdaproteobacteria bacterium]